MNPVKKLLGQTAIYGISTIVGRLIVFLFVPLYTRLFVPEVYGVVGELYSYIAMIMVILTFGMETGFFRYAEKVKDINKVYKSTFTPVFIIAGVFVIISTLFSQSIANTLQYPEQREYIIYCVFMMGFDALSYIPFAKLRFENRPLRFALIKLTNIFLYVSLNLFFLVLCPYLEKEGYTFIEKMYNKELGISYIFISNLVASAVTALMLLPEFPKKLFDFDSKLFKEILNFSLPLIIVGLAASINEVLDRVLLKNISADNINAMEQVGIYNANYKIAILMTLFIQAFRYGAEPFFFKQSSLKNSTKTYAIVMNYFVLFGLLIFLGVNLFIDYVKYFIGNEYHSGLHIVPVLLLANLFLGIIYNLSIWYKLTNKTKYGAVISVSGAFVTITLNLVLIPRMGYTGSAWATLACYSTMMIISFLWGRKHLKIDYPIIKMSYYFISAIALVLLFYNSLWLQNQGILSSIILFFIFLIQIYLSEAKNIKSILSNK